MSTALIEDARANDPGQVRLVQDGRILLGAYGITAPTGTDWDPSNDLTGGTRTDIGYYSEDGFTLTPEPGDNTQIKAHNEDVVVDQDAPGTWAVNFAAFQQKKAVVEAYFDATVNSADGSITLTKASVSTFRDLVTVGIAGDNELIITHYPRVKVSDRDALTYAAGSVNSYGITFRAFKDPITGYIFKQWSTFLVGSDIAVPTISGASPATQQAEAGNVVLTGTNFGTVSAVTFGGTPASFVINSGTQLTAIMPAGASGPAPIVATNVGGDSAPFDYARS